VGIVDAVKAFFSAIAEAFGFFDRKQLLDAGKAAEAGEQARETLDLVKDVQRPITDAERNSVWDRLQAERKGK